MMTKRPPTIGRMNAGAARLLAERLAPPENRAAFQDAAAIVLSQFWSDVCGGDRIRLWVPKLPVAERDARRQRIVAALQAGESTEVIARREGVSCRWVRKLRSRVLAVAASARGELSGP